MSIKEQPLSSHLRIILSAQRRYLPFDPYYHAEKSWDPPSTPAEHSMKAAPIKILVSTTVADQANAVIASPPKESLGSLSVPAPNKPAAKSGITYDIPTAFDPYKYGRPSETGSLTTKRKLESIHEAKPVYGFSRSAPVRHFSTDPRTVIIKALPPDPTLEMVTLICKRTGPVETITLFRSLRKARVSFVNAKDAVLLFDRSANGVDFVYEEDGKAVKHTSFIEMKPDINFVSSFTRDLVKKGASRCIKIVGWDRESLEYLVGSEDEDQSYDDLLTQLARIYTYTCIDERIEGVKWRKNGQGILEGLLIYARIKDAVCGLEAMLVEPELQGCKITYGKDPCTW